MDYQTGIDVGSTTVKLVVCDARGYSVHADYRRHRTRTRDTLAAMLADALARLGDPSTTVTLTGSAGLGLAESSGLPFVQEVVASTRLVRRRYPEVRTLVEIGGEDSKIVYFDDRHGPDIRMNGSCAGGTGSFIEQMAVLLHVSLEEFDRLAGAGGEIHAIASRCGVFAKTDIQALLSGNARREDVAASVFHAVVLQVMATLARGVDVRAKVLFAGGPLTFFPHLRRAFIRHLNLDEADEVVCDRPELLTALGAALYHAEGRGEIRLSELRSRVGAPVRRTADDAGEGLTVLFPDPDAYAAWEAEHARHRVPRVVLGDLRAVDCYLGVDAGSTTTKLVLMDEKGRVALTHYANNDGDPLEAVRRGLADFHQRCAQARLSPRIVRTAVTGYGEGLIRAAFGIDDGIVETLAHTRAARTFLPEVSFILDIGGQDMKAMTVRDGHVADLQINEACSSGCGSFLETFARSLDLSVDAFARLACEARRPVDLGTRCTVFMNSKVKQALRDGATVADISAGLAYSVVKNSLYKVLKLRDPAVLGERICVQGGTFRNPAVLRALEVLLGRPVVRADLSELMGAYGAALTARHRQRLTPARRSTFAGLDVQLPAGAVRKSGHRCRGCENRCRVTTLRFPNGRRYQTGNRCERHAAQGDEAVSPGVNLFEAKLRLLFDVPPGAAAPGRPTFGLPRALNLYENAPFWTTFLTDCGFGVVLSDPSSTPLFEAGVGTVMSDNVCFPAKLVHGHILNLLGKGVERIFFPQVVYEHQTDARAGNSYNCPVVTGYPDVIKSAIDPAGRHGVPVDSPAVSFRDAGLLKRQLAAFVRPLGVGSRQAFRAVDHALKVAREKKRLLQDRAASILEQAERDDRLVIVLAGRPYHADPLINHGIPELLASWGCDVIPEDVLPLTEEHTLGDSRILTQWGYANRILAAAKFVVGRRRVEMVQMTSFGCGLDAVIADEAREIARRGGKLHTMIKMDEITNLGAVKIRLRSLLQVEAERREEGRSPATVMPPERRYRVSDRERTILVPWFSPFYSPLLPVVFKSFGYRFEVLPPQERGAVETGLRFVNNDMCYPALIVIGDIVNAFHSGRHDPSRTAVLLTQTFGQCRASNYLPLLRKALDAAGCEDVPILSFSTLDGQTPPGFDIDRKKLLQKLFLTLIFADALARLYLATVARERTPGEATRVHAASLERMEEGLAQGRFSVMLRLLREAVAAFNAVPVHDRTLPVVGVLGEIFVKHNAFSNHHVVSWLVERGVEVVTPSLAGFFLQHFINEDFNRRAALRRMGGAERLTLALLDPLIRFRLRQVEAVLEGFRYNRPAQDLRELARETRRAISLVNQAGEGWLLTAEMIAMISHGVRHIVCLQPFGCLANHITGKGIEKRLRALYPDVNLLFLDMDAGASEINAVNRLHLLLMAAHEAMGTNDGSVPVRRVAVHA